MRYLIPLLLALPAHAGLWPPGMPLNPEILKAARERQSVDQCYSLRDADQRAYCLALAHRNPGGCYNVVDADARAACLREVHNE